MARSPRGVAVGTAATRRAGGGSGVLSSASAISVSAAAARPPSWPRLPGFSSSRVNVRPCCRAGTADRRRRTASRSSRTGGPSSADVRSAGDEPLMLARALPAVPVLVGADRYLSGRLAEEQLGVTVHLLDDGFQHFGLARDVDLLVSGEEDLIRLSAAGRSSARAAGSRGAGRCRAGRRRATRRRRRASAALWACPAPFRVARDDWRTLLGRHSRDRRRAGR